MSDKSVQDERQELFNTAYLGLAGQGFEQSRDDELDNCMYRGPEDRKCAVGHLINDDVASYYEYDAVSDKLLEAAGIDPEHRMFLEILQNDHDSHTVPENMRKALERTAEEFNLTVPEIPQNG